jgi:hypothetical protein
MQRALLLSHRPAGAARGVRASATREIGGKARRDGPLLTSGGKSQTSPRLTQRLQATRARPIPSAGGVPSHLVVEIADGRKVGQLGVKGCFAERGNTKGRREQFPPAGKTGSGRAHLVLCPAAGLARVRRLAPLDAVDRAGRRRRARWLLALVGLAWAWRRAVRHDRRRARAVGRPRRAGRQRWRRRRWAGHWKGSGGGLGERWSSRCRRSPLLDDDWRRGWRLGLGRERRARRRRAAAAVGHGGRGEELFPGLWTGVQLFRGHGNLEGPRVSGRTR